MVVAHVCRGRVRAQKHTWAFEDTCAWLAAHCIERAHRAAAHRVAHRGRDRGPRVADGRDTNDLLDGLTRIGIDEIAYRKGHRYLTCVVDHATGRLVWAGEGRNSETLGRFFDELEPRGARLTHRVLDGAAWIHTWWPNAHRKH